MLLFGNLTIRQASTTATFFRASFRLSLISISLWLVAGCHQPGAPTGKKWGGKMSSAGFLYERTCNGDKVWLAFFSSWHGYEHPVALDGAISYEESQELGAYYNAYFQGEKDKEYLVRVDKILLTREPYLLVIDQERRGNELVLREAVGTDAGYEPGRAIALDETIDMARYFEHVLLPSAPPEVRLVSKETDYSYRYEYSLDGALKKAVIVSGGERRTLDYSTGR